MKLSKEQWAYLLNMGNPCHFTSTKEVLKWWRWRELKKPVFHEWEMSWLEKIKSLIK